MNETDAWQVFTSTGKVQDYLRYISFRNNTSKDSTDINNREYENIDNGTYHQTTEYR